MKSLPAERASSEPSGEHEAKTPRLRIWDLHTPLLHRFIHEAKLGPSSFRSIADLATEAKAAADSPLLVVAASIDALSPIQTQWLQEQLDAPRILILPACDLRLWRRLTRLGWDEILAPPFDRDSLQLIKAVKAAPTALCRRMPELEARIRSHLHCVLPAELRYVLPTADLLGRLAREQGFPREVWSEALPLAVDEALSNAIRHGCGEDSSLNVDVQLQIQDDQLEIRIEDPGPGFDTEGAGRPPEAEDLLKPGGRGLWLMRALMDRVVFEDGGRTVMLYARRQG